LPSIQYLREHFTLPQDRNNYLKGLNFAVFQDNPIDSESDYEDNDGNIFTIYRR